MIDERDKIEESIKDIEKAMDFMNNSQKKVFNMYSGQNKILQDMFATTMESMRYMMVVHVEILKVKSILLDIESNG